MIATELQDDFIVELNRLLKDERFKNEAYNLEDETLEENIKLNIFSQDLPLESNREDEDESYFPYVIVKLDGGSIGGEDSSHEVKILILIGLFDDSNDNQGYRDVMHIINKIYERFAKHPTLNKKYIAKYPFSWTLQDESVHPYYFGGIEMLFEIPGVRREDELA